MTRDKILELARTAGGYDGFTSAPSDWDSGDFVISPEQLERFAALVAAAEREACAKARLPPEAFKYRVQILEGKAQMNQQYDDGFCDGISAFRAAIRARGDEK